MENASPTQSTYDALEAAYDALNHAAFGGALPPVIITLRRLRAAAGGRYKPADYAPAEGEPEPIGSITLSPEILTSERRTIAALSYAMAHHDGAPHGPKYYFAALGVRLNPVIGATLIDGGVAEGVLGALKASGWGLDYAGQITRRKSQETYMLKASCPECGYLVRLTRKWASVGLPRCPVHDITLTLDNE